MKLGDDILPQKSVVKYLYVHIDRRIRYYYTTTIIFMPLKFFRGNIQTHITFLQDELD